jgi:hypothetical protein
MPNFQPGGAFLPNADYSMTGTVLMPGQLEPVVVAAVDGAISIAAQITRLTKGSAAAMTLAAPTAAQEGTVLMITAGSAFAHVVTATSLIQDGVTGGAKTTMTFAAFVGATITLIALNLQWYVVSKNAVAVT